MHLANTSDNGRQEFISSWMVFWLQSPPRRTIVLLPTSPQTTVRHSLDGPPPFSDVFQRRTKREPMSLSGCGRSSAGSTICLRDYLTGSATRGLDLHHALPCIRWDWRRTDARDRKTRRVKRPTGSLRCHLPDGLVERRIYPGTISVRRENEDNALW